MADPNPSLDLRLTPDWLKEPEPTHRFSHYEGEDDRRKGPPRRDDGAGRRRGPDDRSRGGAPDRRSPGAFRPPSTDARRSPGAPSRDGGPGARRGDRADRFERGRTGIRDDAGAALATSTEPAPVYIDFLPEERAFGKIIQQIKGGHVAYPLFGLARMFLERPERHRVRIRSQDNSKHLYQLGDHGPVATEAALLERLAFAEYKDDFYVTETVEKEPLKGNFTSVARCTLSGRLLGPTSYHTYQTTMRSLYEQRFSRRMSFEDYRRTIEITSSPDLVNQWKEEARKSTIYKTKEEENPTVFENVAAVEQHFRSHHLARLVRPCLAGEVSGETARGLADRGIVAAVRAARDRENRFPAQMAGALRHGLNGAGLHVFKHKKRILYISTVRPQPFNPKETSVSPGLAAVLSALRSYPKITRKQLAEKVLAKTLGGAVPAEGSPEYQQARTALAGDLIWLAKAGHVIEFADGTLDLPLPPKAYEEKAPDKGPTALAASAEHDVPETASEEGEIGAGDDEELAHHPGPAGDSAAPTLESDAPHDALPAGELADETGAGEEVSVSPSVTETRSGTVTTGAVSAGEPAAADADLDVRTGDPEVTVATSGVAPISSEDESGEGRAEHPAERLWVTAHS